jgi:hypothetical protein
MTVIEMKKEIIKKAKIIRYYHKRYSPKDSKLIEINKGLPYIAINLPNGNGDYFFQGENAEELLKEAEKIKEKFRTTIEDSILYLTTCW